MAVTCTGRIDESGSLGLELAETASRDGTTPPSIHIRAVNEGLAQRHVPGISAGMLLVTVNGVAISGVPYDTVLEMLGQRPLELGLAESPHKLPAAFKATTATVHAASRWRAKAQRSAAQQRSAGAAQAAAPAAAPAPAPPPAAVAAWARPEPEPEPEPEPMFEPQPQHAAAAEPEVLGVGLGAPDDGAMSAEEAELQRATFDYFKSHEEDLTQLELTRLLDAADYEVGLTIYH